MKIAVIAPTPLLEEYATLGDAYHLCLSAQVLKDPDYRRFYQWRSKFGDHVILDNSAHEQLEGQGIEDLCNAAAHIDPSEIVLPDRLFFGDDTFERSQDAYGRLRSAFPRAALMGVPQGRTFSEWAVCLVKLLELGVDTIGVSKDYEVWPGGLKHLLAQIPLPPSKIHLLGWGRQLWDLAALSTLARGVDSAKPLVYAANEMELPHVLTPDNSPKYPRKGGDFFERGQVAQQRTFFEYARANIATFRAAATDHRYCLDEHACRTAATRAAAYGATSNANREPNAL